MATIVKVFNKRKEIVLTPAEHEALMTFIGEPATRSGFWVSSNKLCFVRRKLLRSSKELHRMAAKIMNLISDSQANQDHVFWSTQEV